MNLKELEVSFNIIGSNQGLEEWTCKGVLALSLNENKMVSAKWQINNNIEQLGTVFF